jgi:hypothetical protein
MEKCETETRCADGVRLYYRYAAALAIHSERVSQKMEAATLEELRRIRCTLSVASKNLTAARQEYFRHIELHQCELRNRPSFSEAQEWSAEAGCAV